MRIKYLGTSAAEGMPALFCECETCNKAREIGGKNIRSRSQMLVNDDLLIDYPPDSFYHFVLNKVDLSKINNLLISHIHEDHFYPLDFAYFNKGFSHPIKCVPFTIYGSDDVKPLINKYIDDERNQGLNFRSLLSYQTYKVGNYYVTPLVASHGTDHPYIYLVSDGIKTLFYCHDSGELKDEVYSYLHEHKVHIDLLSIDCNEGNSEHTWSCHMNLATNIETISKLKEIGCIDDNAKIVLSHFSHNGKNVLYEEMEPIARKYSFIVSFDGLEIEL